MLRSGSLSLRAYLWALAGIGLLPLALAGAWAIWSAAQNQRHELERSTIELSRALASAVDSELDATLTGLAALSSAPSLRQGDLAGFHQLTRDVASGRMNWTSVALTSPAGRMLLKSDLPFAAASQALVDPAGQQRALDERKPVVGNIFADPTGQPRFAIHLPVLEDGELRYLLTATVMPDRIRALVERQQMPVSWNVAVFDAQKRRVARSKDHSNTVGRPVGPSLTALLDSHREAGTGITITNEGTRVYTGFVRLKPSDWTVAVGAPVAETRAALGRTLRWYAAGIALSVLGCAFLAHLTGRVVARDIRALRDRAVRLGQGQPVDLAPSAISEVRETGVALQMASERLQQASASMAQALHKAEDAGRVKDQFLAMLGHELRNPLAPMLTAVHLMDLKSHGSLANERRILRRQVTHMRSLVDDLLDVSRITSGKMSIQRRPVNLPVVVDRAVETLQPAVAQRGVQLSVQVPDTPVWVDGDEDRLVQVLTNLIGNALRFDPGGSVSVTLTWAPGRARLAVQDQGAGMSPQTLEHVFEPFYQAQQSIDRSVGGLGLGLAIVRAIVGLHGGTVTAASQGPGKGSRFEVELSTIAPPAETSPSAPQAHAAAGKILVVDDNIDALQSLTEILTLAGHEVRGATSPKDALEMLSGFRADVALFDIGLPEMDGYELARRTRALPNWGGKLVALTGYGQKEDQARAHDAGFAVHLTKPVEASTLLNVVDQLLLHGVTP